MPKYYPYKIGNCYLYFTMKCIVEAVHVHASDKKLTEQRSAKFFVKDNGDTIIQRKGKLTQKEIVEIQKFIKGHYKEMYNMWRLYSKNSFYKGK